MIYFKYYDKIGIHIQLTIVGDDLYDFILPDCGEMNEKSNLLIQFDCSKYASLVQEYCQMGFDKLLANNSPGFLEDYWPQEISKNHCQTVYKDPQELKPQEICKNFARKT